MTLCGIGTGITQKFNLRNISAGKNTLKGEKRQKRNEIKVLCEQTRELTHDFLDYV